MNAAPLNTAWFHFGSFQSAILCFRENSVEIPTTERDPVNEHELKVCAGYVG